MENIIITTVTSIVAAIVASCLTSILTFRFWQIKNRVELLNKLNNACLKLDSAFQEYLKLDSLLGSSYYGMDSNGNRYTQDKLLIESKLVSIIDEIQSMQNTLNNSKLLQIIEQYIELFREADKIFLETYKENYGDIKNNVIIGIKGEVLKVNSILSIFKYQSI
ncbi:MAG: hypothetical protein K2X04_06605 [Burkholderiales bacterium]|nr:hypothetical protein [Burkholderiales bacterium]